ncbi:MAG: hypothetical protein ACI8PZ_007470 [Myxococcota bacterium]
MLYGNEKMTLANVLVAGNHTGGAENDFGGVLIVHASSFVGNDGTALSNGLTGQLFQSCTVLAENGADVDPGARARVESSCVLSADNGAPLADWDAISSHVCLAPSATPFLDPITLELRNSPPACEACLTGLDPVSEAPAPVLVNFRIATIDAEIVVEESDITLVCGAEHPDASIPRFSFGYEAL